MIRLHFVFGPNLDQLGLREPERYGHQTLADIEARLSEYCERKGVSCCFFQSNHEGELIKYIHKIDTGTEATGLVINSSGLSHTSVSLRDAIAFRADITAVSIHQTNIHQREDFRVTDIVATACFGSIVGFGVEGYCLAAEGLITHLS